MPYDTYDLIAHTDQQIERPRLRFGNSKNLYPSEASVSYIDEFGDCNTLTDEFGTYSGDLDE